MMMMLIQTCVVEIWFSLGDACVSLWQHVNTVQQVDMRERMAFCCIYIYSYIEIRCGGGWI